MSTTILRYGEQTAAESFEQITVTGTAASCTAAKLLDTNSRPCQCVTVTVETNPIRVRWDGTNPTASIGHLLQPGDELVLQGVKNISNLAFIATGSNALVTNTYEFYP